MGKRSTGLRGWLAGSVLTALLLSGCGGADGQQTADAIDAADATDAAGPPSDSAATAPMTSAPPTPADASATTGASASSGATSGFQDPTSNSPGTEEAVADPTRVRIPSIGVDAPLETLSVNADNALQPPVAWDAAGWYDQSPVPGERGPSVIAGHLVAPDGPAVFVDLGSLVPGDLVDVERADGTVSTFAVDRTISAERTDSFPTSEIYGPTPDAQLRLITCDGEYDPARGHWTRNMVVFASEVAA